MYPTILVLALASPPIGVPLPRFFRLPPDNLPNAVESKNANLAGWYKLTPIYRDYEGPRFDAPFSQRVKGSEPVYSQTLHFKGTGAARRSFSITFARDAEFRKQFTADALKALDEAPEALRIDDWSAWVWPNQRKIVVVVDADKAVILKNVFPQTKLPLVDCARRLDFKYIREQLGKPPRIDFALTLDTFRMLRKDDPLALVVDWCGQADEVESVDSEKVPRKAFRFELKDGSTVVVTGRNAIEQIRHEKNGKIVEWFK